MFYNKKLIILILAIFGTMLFFVWKDNYLNNNLSFNELNKKSHHKVVERKVAVVDTQAVQKSEEADSNPAKEVTSTKPETYPLSTDNLSIEAIDKIELDKAFYKDLKKNLYTLEKLGTYCTTNSWKQCSFCANYDLNCQINKDLKEIEFSNEYFGLNFNNIEELEDFKKQQFEGLNSDFYVQYLNAFEEYSKSHGSLCYSYIENCNESFPARRIDDTDRKYITDSTKKWFQIKNGTND